MPGSTLTIAYARKLSAVAGLFSLGSLKDQVQQGLFESQTILVTKLFTKPKLSQVELLTKLFLGMLFLVEIRTWECCF